MILLYSFEGTTFRYGGNSCEDTPVPMPNTEVKLTNAESTWLEAAWEDRKLPNKMRHLKRCLFYLAILVTPRPDAYVGKIVKGYKGKMRRPGLRLADKCPYSVPLKRDFLLHAGVLLV